MKSLLRNKQTFYYSLYTGTTDGVDEDGYLTGEEIRSYTNPQPMKASIAEPSGYTAIMQFGTNLAYDRQLVFDRDPGFDEYTILWIDHLPVVDGVETPHDYRVVRVSRSLNVVSVFVRKVNEE